ncbi:MAG: exodeoxyribonuclease VII large subunit [Tissierellaceae bacterium]
MEVRPLKVSEVNGYIKRLVLSDMILSNLSLEGEISNFKHHYSGHMYFNLKDEKAKIKAVMFKGDNESLSFIPEDGLMVVASGYVSVYERDGEYQLYVRHLKEKGLGDLYKAFEELKVKLEKEGLFLESSKKAIPTMPKKIGVVTSSTGAAIRDIITVLRRRFPPCQILIYPALVQGNRAAEEISKGLAYLDSRDDIDLIITGRGGGSIEELFAFNDENLARTIYSLKTPIITAIGHETDFTIADFVSDLRAPTPSAAAELSVPDILELEAGLKKRLKDFERIVTETIRKKRAEIDLINANLKYYNPINRLRDKRQELDGIFKDMNYGIERIIATRSREILDLKSRLDILNPALVISSGYGIIEDQAGNIIRSIGLVEQGDEISIILKDGKILASVKDIEEGGWQDEINL